VLVLTHNCIDCSPDNRFAARSRAPAARAM